MANDASLAVMSNDFGFAVLASEKRTVFFIILDVFVYFFRL